MLKFFCVTLESIAGLFLFFVTLMVYMSGLPPLWRFVGALVCLIPFALAMLCGLALVRFRHWRRDIGIVLLTVTAVTVTGIWSLACMMLSEEFQRLMAHTGPSPFGNYVMGTIVNGIVAYLGWSLVKKDLVAHPS